MSRFVYSEVASSLHDGASIDRILEPVRRALIDHGGVPAQSPADVFPHLIVVATGGTEQAVLDSANRRREFVSWEPIVLVTHALHNSLPAALEALARLRQDGIPGRIVQLADDDELESTVEDLVVLHWLRQSRLGLVGTPSEWLVASVPDPGALRQRWGIELVDADIAEAIDLYPSVSEESIKEVAVAFTPHGSTPNADTVAAAAVLPTLDHLISQHRLDAVAVRCFDFLTDIETSGCVALAQLNDVGFVAGCEGDVASTVSMMLARRLLGRPSWVANPARIDPRGGELTLAHCTVAPSMVSDIELHTHFESGIGVGFRGTFEPGPVTLMRLGGRELERHWFADAEIIGGGSSPDLCRTQVVLKVEAALDDLLDDPLGNHIVMVAGHHSRRLERWWRLVFG